MTSLKRAAVSIAAAALLSVALAQNRSYELALLADGLTLPVHALALEDGRVLVARLDGVVELVEGGVVREAPFLSLAGRVTAQEGEQGLFTIALESDATATAAGRPRQLLAAFTEKGSGDLVVSAFDTDPELSSADRGSEVELVRVAIVDPFHHGGQVAFGPDGLVYLSIGTGQRYEVFGERAGAISQSDATLRGKVVRFSLPNVLRIVGTSYQPSIRTEVYARGFRNPWKFWIDPDSGRMLLADVGEDLFEEINDVVRGGNYGWPSREGPACFLSYDGVTKADPDCGTPSQRLMIDPLAHYGHPHIDPAGGVAVVAGVVVRDTALGALVGRFLFADFALGRVWSLDLESRGVELVLEAGVPITSITDAPDGAVLLTSFSGGLYRLLLAR